MTGIWRYWSVVVEAGQKRFHGKCMNRNKCIFAAFGFSFSL